MHLFKLKAPQGGGQMPEITTFECGLYKSDSEANERMISTYMK